MYFDASVISRQASVAKARVAGKPKLGDTKEDQPLSAKVNDRVEAHSLSRSSGRLRMLERLAWAAAWTGQDAGVVLQTGIIHLCRCAIDLRSIFSRFAGGHGTPRGRLSPVFAWEMGGAKVRCMYVGFRRSVLLALL